MRKTIVMTITLLSGMLATQAKDPTKNPSFTLVENGKPAAEIVLSEHPTRSAQFAAAELQYHVKKLTNTTLPIVTEATAPATVRVFVGESEATRMMGLKSENFAPQEYLIDFRKEGLVLMGRDKNDHGKVDYLTEKTFPKEFDEQGTCYAVYDFLEKFCGVRWYLPTELGLVYEPVKTLTVSGRDIRRRPFMRYRFVWSAMRIPADLCGDTVGYEKPTILDRRESALWARRSRLGGEPYECRHSFTGYYDRFLKTHPEWFAQGYEGKPPQMCYTSPGLVEQVVKDARDYFDGKKVPGAIAKGDYFAVVPQDGSGWCMCPACRKLQKVDRDPNEKGSELSDYIFQFVNKVAREVRKTHPDKYIATIAYIRYLYPPTFERMEPNVAVQLCMSPRTDYNRRCREKHAQCLKSWNSTNPQSIKFIWSYFCFPSLDARGQQFRCFPGFFASALIRHMKEYYHNGVRGIFIEPSYLIGQTRSVLMDQLELYLALKLADDPQLNGTVLINEFFERYYGAAAKPMKELYQAIERTYSDPVNYPEGTYKQTEAIAWSRLGTEKRMEEYAKLMAEAHKLAKTDLEKQRVDLFDQGIWQYMLAGRKTYLKTTRLRNAPLQTALVPMSKDSLSPNNFAQIDWSRGYSLANWLTTHGEKCDGYQIEGRALHDDRFLYVQLTETADPAIIEKTGRPLWEMGRAAAEWWLLFARQRGAPYRQLLISQDGKYIIWRHGGKELKSNAVVKLSNNDTNRSTVEIALPLAELLPGGVKLGETVYFNCLRVSWYSKIAPIKPLRDHMAWNPTFSGWELGRASLERLGEFKLER